jgi:cell division protein FtsW
MGIRKMNFSERKRPKKVKRLVQLGFDIPLLLITLTILVFGALMLYSASTDFSLTYFEDPNYLIQRQFRWIVLGLIIMVLLAMTDYHFWQRAALPALGITVLALIAVLAFQQVRYGAVRTIFQGSYQPSELAKPIIVIYLAVWLFSKREYLQDVGFGLLPLGVLLGGIGGLILSQPDLSGVIIIVFLGGMMFFLAGGDIRQIVVVVIFSVLVGWLVVQGSATGSARIADYLAGIRDPTQGSYHMQRALEAFVNGSWFGTGFGKSVTKFTGLPVAPTDSIYAVIGEETGVIGSVLTLLMYCALLWRGLVIAQRAPDLLGALMASGLSIWITLEAFINMAVLIGLFPFAGNALPLVSSGGSSMFVVMMSIGVLLSISRMTSKRNVEAASTFGPVVDLNYKKRRQTPV